MCRNIRVLHGMEPPTTEAEVRDAALQFVRKVSGAAAPARGAEVAFARAVDEITRATLALLGDLPARATPRTREGERARARARWERQKARGR